MLASWSCSCFNCKSAFENGCSHARFDQRLTSQSHQPRQAPGGDADDTFFYRSRGRWSSGFSRLCPKLTARRRNGNYERRNFNGPTLFDDASETLNKGCDLVMVGVSPSTKVGPGRLPDGLQEVDSGEQNVHCGAGELQFALLGLDETVLHRVRDLDARLHADHACRALDGMRGAHHGFQPLGARVALFQRHKSFGQDLAVVADLLAEQIDQKIVAAGFAHRMLLSNASNSRAAESRPMRLFSWEKSD